MSQEAVAEPDLEPEAEPGKAGRPGDGLVGHLREWLCRRLLVRAAKLGKTFAEERPCVDWTLLDGKAFDRTWIARVFSIIEVVPMSIPSPEGLSKGSLRVAGLSLKEFFDELSTPLLCWLSLLDANAPRKSHPRIDACGEAYMCADGTLPLPKALVAANGRLPVIVLPDERVWLGDIPERCEFPAGLWTPHDQAFRWPWPEVVVRNTPIAIAWWTMLIEAIPGTRHSGSSRGPQVPVWLVPQAKPATVPAEDETATRLSDRTQMSERVRSFHEDLRIRWPKEEEERLDKRILADIKARTEDWSAALEELLIGRSILDLLIIADTFEIIHRMSSRDRSVYCLLTFAKLSDADVAQAVHVKIGNLRKILHLLIGRSQKRLADLWCSRA